MYACLQSYKDNSHPLQTHLCSILPARLAQIKAEACARMQVAGNLVDEVIGAYTAKGVRCIKIGEPSTLDEVIITGKSGSVEYTGTILCFIHIIIVMRFE